MKDKIIIITIYYIDNIREKYKYKYDTIFNINKQPYQ